MSNKLNFIKSKIDKSPNNSIDINAYASDNKGEQRLIKNVFKSYINDNPTEYYFADTDKAISSLEVISDDMINKIIDKIK